MRVWARCSRGSAALTRRSAPGGKPYVWNPATPAIATGWTPSAGGSRPDSPSAGPGVTGASTVWRFGAWRFGAALLVGGYAALTGCASTTPGLDAHSAALARLVAARAVHADIVYLGESHDNPHHHLDQIRVLEVMLADGARPALAFEMLAQDQQQAVDAAMLESADRSALAKRLGWGERGWPDFEMYRPLFDLARRYGLPVIAIDLSQIEE